VLEQQLGAVEVSVESGLVQGSLQVLSRHGIHISVVGEQDLDDIGMAAASHSDCRKRIEERPYECTLGQQPRATE